MCHLFRWCCLRWCCHAFATRAALARIKSSTRARLEQLARLLHHHRKIVDFLGPFGPASAGRARLEREELLRLSDTAERVTADGDELAARGPCLIEKGG